MTIPRIVALSLTAKAMMFCLFGPFSTVMGAVNSDLPRVAIIQLANHTSSLKVQDHITKLLHETLTTMGYGLVDMDTLRTEMRAKRLRLVGEIDSAGADQIATQTGAEVLLTGSVDIYLEQVNPEVSISLRAYDCISHKVIWVDCLSMTGEDQAGLFGIGRITGIEQLTAKVIKKQLDRMPELTQVQQKSTSRPTANDRKLIPRGRVAVVRFDNSTDFANADAVVTNAVIQEAWRRGYDVVEAGELSRLRTRLASDFQGGIGGSALSILRDEYGVTMVVTGTVTRFLPNRGASAEAVPEIEYTMRSIDPNSGEVISSLSIEHNGSEHETLFGVGRVSAIGEVAHQAIRDGWDELIASWIKRMPASKSSRDGEQNAQR